MKTSLPLALAILVSAQIMVPPGLGAEIDSDVAPPPPRVEHAPPPRDGYVWAPGHWAWSGKSYNWCVAKTSLETSKSLPRRLTPSARQRFERKPIEEC